MRPAKIGDYKVIDSIYDTEMSCLYKAVECVDGQEEQLFYGLKHIKSGENYGLSMEKEKQITHAIDNRARENIAIPVLKVIREQGEEYAVMKFYHHGVFLSELISQLERQYGKGGIPLELQLEILEEVLHALHILHSCLEGRGGCGYLHMDIHPGNLFLENCDLSQGRIGSVKFLDFQNALMLNLEGIAKQEGNPCFTSPGFSAPELVDAENGVYTAAADLYSVTALAARMLTGCVIENLYEAYHPYVKRSLETLSVNGVVLHLLEHFYNTGMEYNPKYRFQSAADMAETIREIRWSIECSKHGDYYLLYQTGYRHLIAVGKAVSDQMDFSSSSFAEAVDRLKLTLDQANGDIVGGHYVFRCLWELKERFRQEISTRTICRLLVCGIHSYNFQGQSAQAAELFQMLEQMKGESGIPVPEYLELIAYVAECYVDTCRFQKAYTAVRKNKEAFDRIKMLYRELAGEMGLDSEQSVYLVERGRIYSAIGRYLAFIRSWEEMMPSVSAEEADPMYYFQTALEEFAEDSGNREITVSHILHYAVETGNELLYRQYAAEYLGAFSGKNAASECLKELIKHSKTALWKLWIFLKGVERFYVKQVLKAEDSAFFELLQRILVDSVLRENSAYPVELIYRCIALILIEGSGSQAEDAIHQAFVCALQYPQSEQIDPEKPLTIRMLIKYQTLWLYQQWSGETEFNEQLRQILLEQSRRSGWKELTQHLEHTENLGELLHYEHC